MGFHLKKGETVASGLRRIAVEQAMKLDEDLQLRDKEIAIHEARKRCKRIRAVVRLLRPVCSEIYDVENPFFRDLARSLSGLRDVKARDDAFQALVKDERPGTPWCASIQTVLRGDAEVAADQDKMKSVLAAAIDDAVKCKARLKSWELPEDAGFELVREGIRQAYKRGRKAMEAAYEEACSEEAFHDWRKRVKDLGYQTQILRKLWPSLMKVLHGKLGELGEMLGQEHDLAVLRESLQEKVGDGITQREFDAFLRLEARRVDELQSEASRLGARIYAEKSGAFIRRMEAYWTVWKGE